MVSRTSTSACFDLIYAGIVYRYFRQAFRSSSLSTCVSMIRTDRESVSLSFLDGDALDLRGFLPIAFIKKPFLITPGIGPSDGYLISLQTYSITLLCFLAFRLCCRDHLQRLSDFSDLVLPAMVLRLPGRVFSVRSLPGRPWSQAEPAV